MKKLGLITCLILYGSSLLAQVFEGQVVDKDDNSPIEGVEIKIVEDSVKGYTDTQGMFSLTALNSDPKTITAEHPDFMFEEYIEQNAAVGIDFLMRKRIKSSATLRWEGYIAANDPTLDYTPQAGWSVSFKQHDLQGDFAPDNTIIRRDPSAVIKNNNTYYVYYSRAIKDNVNQFFPWDRCDIYYATSTDGETWIERGAAVSRGSAGSFDDRSIFTPEVLEHEGKFYLVYQAVKDPYVERVKNTVGMSWADSPDGPWTKLPEPILRPTNNGIWKGTQDDRFSVYKKGDFDSHKVHDPTLIHYNGKFYLYYKGERMGEERYFGQREIKWGVAIADNPFGPYEKSVSNPITNTGHELVLWKYKSGIAIINTLDGPEREHILYSEDGINFEIMSTAKNLPNAQGLFRSPVSDTDPLAGVNWGLSHVLKWDVPGGWMYINKFEIDRTNVTSTMIPYDTAAVHLGQTRKLRAYAQPVNATEKGIVWESTDNNVVSVNNSGEVTGKLLGEAKVFATSVDGGFTDSVVVKVIENEVLTNEIVVQAASFTNTGNPDGLGYGGPIGMNKNGSNINYVNRDDWATYNLDIPASGRYHVEYFVSTPTSPAQLSLYVGDERVDLEDVYTNGQWDSYYRLPGNGVFDLTEGTQEVKLVASGSNDWQWNMDQMRFYGEALIEKVDVNSVEIISNSDTIVLTETMQLSSNVVPANATFPEVSWHSSNEEIATVSNSGLVETFLAGKTTITLTSVHNPDISDKLELTVVDPLLSINDVSHYHISLYPNPASGQIRVHGIGGTPSSISIHTIDGRKMDCKVKTSSGELVVELSSLQPGVHIMHIITDNQVLRKKFIVENP